MLDMGFLPQLEKIMALLPHERQSLFFSATMPPRIRDLSKRLLFNPLLINVSPRKPAVESIEHRIYMVEKKNKLSVLRDLLVQDSVERAIVFTRTKRSANVLTGKLEFAGFRTAAIHGNKSQGARLKALEAFRQSQIGILVATDVASRGIDIDGITHVINYDMPAEPECYVHRIGRTGRAGADGIAVSFCTSEDRVTLQAIERLIRQRLPIFKTRVRTTTGDSRREDQNESPARQTRPRRSGRSRASSGNSQPHRSSRRGVGRRRKSRQQQPPPTCKAC
jgi:ATP-dependent RNA helicase RhlE